MFSSNTYYRETFYKNDIPFQIWEEVEKKNFYCVTFFSVDKGPEYDTIEESRKAAEGIMCPKELGNIIVNDCFVVMNGDEIQIGEYPKGQLQIELIGSLDGRWWGAASLNQYGNGFGIPLTINEKYFNSRNECIKYWIDYSMKRIDLEPFRKIVNTYAANLCQLTLF